MNNKKVGILEFDIPNIDGLYTRGLIEAHLMLKVKSGDLSDGRCLSIYSIPDEHENGMLEGSDKDTTDYIDEICAELQPEDTISFDVTSAIEHDLFDQGQGSFSGFIIDRSTEWEDCIEFYDHTDSVNGPRLSYEDGDDIPYEKDDCPASKLVETIIIDDCDSEVYNQLFDNGCTMSDLITECANDAKNHGRFVSCLSQLTKDWINQRLISRKDKGAIQNCVVHQKIP